MDLKPGDYAAWGALSLAVAAVFERVIGHLLRGRYVTREEMQAETRALKDQQTIEAGMRAALASDLSVLKVTVDHLPTVTHIDEIKSSVSELKEGQAVSREKLDGLKEDIDKLSVGVERLGEELRRRP